MSVLLIIEPDCSGHRAGYVRWIAQAAVEAGHDVQVATFEHCADHPIFLAMREDLGSMLQMVFLREDTPRAAAAGVVDLVRHEFRYRSLLARFYAKALEERKPDVVLVSYLDNCANAISVLGSPFGDTPWVGITMRQAFHYAPLGIAAPSGPLLHLKRMLFLRLLDSRHLRALFTIDETLPRFVRETRPQLAQRLHYLPDPAEVEGAISIAAARAALGIPINASVILVYGAIDPRKGVDVLLDALTMGPVPDELYVLVAGKRDGAGPILPASPQVKALEQAGRIRQINKFLSKEEELTVLKASTVVWLGYRNHYVMSGVMVQAGKMGLPVVACKEGLIGWTTEAAKSGVVVDTSDLAMVREGLMRLVQNPSFAEECGRNGYGRFSCHTAKAFGESIVPFV